MNLFEWNEAQILTFFFVLARVCTIVAILPIFGDRVIPATVKLLFGVALSFIAYPIVRAIGAIDPAIIDSPSKLVWATFREAAFGALIGFSARWVFDAVLSAGYFMGTAMGFSMASVFDPHSESQTVALAELQYVLAALLFLAMNGHHVYLSGILDSFRVVPLGKVELLEHHGAILQYLVDMTAQVLVLAVKLSAPVITVILIINLMFGILARAVPQLNALTVSFTANIAVGLFVLFVSLPSFMNMVNGAFDSYGPELQRLMRILGG